MNKSTNTPLAPKIVLGVAAHPDDLDFGAGGTMAAFARAGAKVYYLVLTDGGKGSSDRTMTPERLRDLRREEQRHAADILGLQEVFFCDYPDGALENTQDVKREVVKVIRQVKPDVVVTLDPTEVYSVAAGLVNHPDHRAAGQAALDALYPLARDHMTFPELLEQGLEPHNVPTVLLIRFAQEHTNYATDITDVFDVKMQAMAAHASQFGDQERLDAWVRGHAAEAGKQYGYTYAEAFVRIDIV
jgi:LmbE family N-acetylglucosaminyl deacetylase